MHGRTRFGWHLLKISHFLPEFLKTEMIVSVFNFFVRKTRNINIWYQVRKKNKKTPVGLEILGKMKTFRMINPFRSSYTEVLPMIQYLSDPFFYFSWSQCRKYFLKFSSSSGIYVGILTFILFEIILIRVSSIIFLIWKTFVSTFESFLVWSSTYETRNIKVESRSTYFKWAIWLLEFVDLEIF